jgi:prepilin-type processing-associated H-X9-DG protein
MAAAYSEEVHEWLQEAIGMQLVARHEGRDATSVNAFVDAARGRAKTLTFVETENGGSVCGGYLDAAWVDGHVEDPSRRSFLFTLKNHLGVPPTKFAQTQCDGAAYMNYDVDFDFGQEEGFMVRPDDCTLVCGETYESPDQGVTLFHGDADGVFRAGRWELWQVR